MPDSVVSDLEMKGVYFLLFFCSLFFSLAFSFSVFSCLGSKDTATIVHSYYFTIARFADAGSLHCVGLCAYYLSHSLCLFLCTYALPFQSYFLAVRAFVAFL